MLLRGVLAFVVALGAGWLGARAASPTMEERPAPGPAQTPPRRVTCVDVAQPAPACPEVDSTLHACEAALAAAESPGARQPFPEVPEPDQPGPWNDNLEQAIAACNLPVQLVATDCDEYPCAAALRVKDEDRERARLAWDACPQLADLSFEAIDVHCPDGATESAWVAITVDEERWKRVLPADLSQDDQFVAFALTYGRRVESTLQLWDCNVAAR